MKVLVCGSRSWCDRQAIIHALVDYDASMVIHGGARGADRLAGEAAELLGLPVKGYNADWDRLGRSAGAIRNRQMIEDGKPDIVMAFWDGKSPGTKDMISVAAGNPLRLLVVVLKSDLL